MSSQDGEGQGSNYRSVSADVSTSPDPREEFIKELRTLCDKHGLYIVHWSGVTRLVPVGDKDDDVLGCFERVLEEMMWDEELPRGLDLPPLTE